MTTDAAVGDLVRLDTQATARPLTEAQAGMWYAQRLDPANPVFNTAQYIEIAGPFDVAVFRAAVRDAMAEADALAIRVIEVGGEPCQVVDDARRDALALTVVDLRGERDPMQAARMRMDADLRRPIDPATDPLAAQMLFVLADERHLWYQRIHHLAIDGYGTVLLTVRVCDLYSSRVTGDAPSTQPFGAFASVLDTDAQYRVSARREEDKAWWLQQFADAPPAPVLAAGPAVTAHDYLRTALDFPSGTGEALRRVAEAADVPWPDVATALVAAYVARHVDADDTPHPSPLPASPDPDTHKPRVGDPGGARGHGCPRGGSAEADADGAVDRAGREVTLGVAAMERLGTPAARVPAMVMNVLPVRIPIDEDRPLPEWLDRASRVLKQARRRGRYRSEQVRRDLGLLGGGKRLHGPLVNVLPFESAPRIAGAAASLHVLATGPVDDLTVTIRTDAAGGHVRAELDANPNLYDQAALSAHAARLAAFIARALTAIEATEAAEAAETGELDALARPRQRNVAHVARVSDVPTLTSEEHARVVVEATEAAETGRRGGPARPRQGEVAHVTRVSDVPTLTPAEYARWVVDVNETAHVVEHTTLTALIERAIACTPDAPAVVFGTRQLSFADLRELADHLAASLIDRGVRRGDIVGVMLPRSIELAATLYAILRIGAAYLPLDHEQPAARLTPMVSLAQPRCVVADAGAASRLPAGTPTVFLDELPGAGNASAAEGCTADDRPLCSQLLTDARPAAAREDARAAIAAMAPAPDDRAYVIFTSGSTGEPKGVVIEHHAIVNRLEWMRTHYAIGPGDRILQKTPYTFDVSVWEFFLPLIAGATLVVAPPGVHKDPRALIDLMRDARVSVAHFVPSMLAELLAEPAAAGLSPRMVFCSGEALPAALRDRFHAMLATGPGAMGSGAAELHNLYGPTEAAVDVTYWPASAADRSDPVPIGYPVWNTRLYILDDRQRPVPPGVAGHLFIGGVQLAREYVARPDLTRERFVADPFGASGDRLYRTGDIARWRADGAVEFLGRSDHQVKIRGQRIELGEIETAIVATGLTPRAVVIAREDIPGDPRLVAYVETQAPVSGDTSHAAAPDAERAAPVRRPDADVAEDDAAEDDAAVARLDDIAAAVAKRLPDVMVPAAFVAVTEWPVTSNGKLDRARLPAPPRASHAGGREPATATEQRVAALFANVLHLELAGSVDPSPQPSPRQRGEGDAIPSPPEGERVRVRGIKDAAALGADSDFFALGGHSLLATQLVRALRAEFGRDIGLGAIFAHPTVARLSAHIDDASRAGGDGLDVLLPLHVPVVSAAAASPRSASQSTSPVGTSNGVAPDGAASDRAAVACIHPAGGIAWCYGNLARALRPERPVYGLQARGLRPGAPLPSSLDALAADYAAELRRVQPDGPYHLIGWSVGGIIAQAMAVHLEAAGARVGLLAALDAYPSDRWRSATDSDEAAALRALLLMAGEEPDEVAARKGPNDRREPVERGDRNEQNGRNARSDQDDRGDEGDRNARSEPPRLTRAIVVDTLRRGRHPLGALSDETLTGVLRVVEHNNRLVRRHVHRPCAARMVHFKASLDATAAVTSADEWLRYVGELYRVDIPFVHAHMTGPEASRLIAPILAEHLR